jgi:hypothetical protein
MPVWFTTVVEKLELVETCTPYEVAPLAAFQLSVGFVETLVAPFDGEVSVGADGGLTVALVVKLQTVEYALVPPVFVALTRQ